MQNQAPAGAPDLRLAIAGHIATLTIDRPARRNAMTRRMWDGLAGLVTRIGAEPDIRVLILRGAGEHFSAGADIGEFDTLRKDADSARAYEASNSAAFAALRRCPVPVVAAIRGICFGGGFGMAAACDLRIASPDALFCVPAALLGLAYPADAMSDIVEAVGAQTAKYLVYSAARIGAEEARRLGFLLEVVPSDAFEAHVADLADRIAENAPLTLKATKTAIRAARSHAPEDADDAVRLGDLTFASHDYAEGRAAFAERRKPRFEGR